MSLWTAALFSKVISADEIAPNQGPRAAEQGPGDCGTQGVGAHSLALALGDCLGHFGDIYPERLRPPARIDAGAGPPTGLLATTTHHERQEPRAGEAGKQPPPFSHKPLIKSNCPYLDSAFFMNKTTENPSFLTSF